MLYGQTLYYFHDYYGGVAPYLTGNVKQELLKGASRNNVGTLYLLADYIPDGKEIWLYQITFNRGW